MPRPDHRAHLAHQEGHREADARARRRIGEIAQVLGLPAPLRAPFALACEQAVHLHTSDCARVDHELRSGRSSSAEDEAARERLAEDEWLRSLDLLRRALPLAAERGARDADPATAEGGRRHAGVATYRPLADLTRRT